MKIIVDAMGGDHAPLQIVLGAVDAIKQDKSLQVVLVGDESAINQCLCDCKDYDKNRLSIIDAKDVITNDDTPTTAIRTKKRVRLSKRSTHSIMTKMRADLFLPVQRAQFWWAHTSKSDALKA